MSKASTAIPADVRERIIAAAADLFEQSGRQTMPTVDAVRRAARVDMNAASSVMKEWRRAQTAQAAPVAVAVPESVQQASSAAVATIWQQAQELANESLRSAQAAWETERAEQDAMRQELAEAFERQAGELEAAGAALAAERVAAEKQAQELADVRQQLAEAVSRADKADARIAEIEHRAADLRAELDRAHAYADRLRTENTDARQQAAAELDTAHAATAVARAQIEQQAAALKLAEAQAAQLAAAQEAAHTAQAALAEAQKRADGLAALLEQERAATNEAQAKAEKALTDAAKLAGKLEALQPAKAVAKKQH